MQTIRKEGLVQELNLPLIEQKLALMIPLVQALQQDLQKLHPSMQEFECIYHQIQGRI